MRDEIQLIAREPRRASAQACWAGHPPRIRIHLIDGIIKETQWHVEVASHDHGA
jgi:hypothetical protein